jgi:hypothetical protein
MAAAVVPLLGMLAVAVGLARPVAAQEPAAGLATAAPSPARPAYPPSPAIRKIEFAPADSIVCAAEGGDNWPITWADDDALYTTWGDGWGFEPKTLEKLSLGFARISGTGRDFRGENVRSTGEQLGSGRNGMKSWGLLSVQGTLYMWLGHADLQGGESRLAWSSDHGKTWTFAPWRFAEFGLIGFVNYGRDYAGARDEYVYAYSHDGPRADTPAGHFILMRAPKGALTRRESWEFLRAVDGKGQPVWTKEIGRRGAVFESPDGALRSAMTYIAPLGRYLWWQHIPAPPGSPDRGDTRHEGGFAVYDAPEPWGPWTTAFQTPRWDVGPGEHGDFPAKWASSDGRTLYLVFAGNDAFCVRRATVGKRPQ